MHNCLKKERIRRFVEERLDSFDQSSLTPSNYVLYLIKVQADYAKQLCDHDDDMLQSAFLSAYSLRFRYDDSTIDAPSNTVCKPVGIFFDARLLLIEEVIEKIEKMEKWKKNGKITNNN
jgi:hypothetical protein